MSYHPTVQESHIRHLQERLKAKEAECTLLAAHNRKLEEALRPFAEAFRDGELKLSEFLAFCNQGHFARAAELVPEEPTSDSLEASPSPP